MNNLEEYLRRFEDLFNQNNNKLLELGFDDLDNLWQELENIKLDTNQEVSKYLLAQSRTENGQFATSNTISFDLAELARLSTDANNLTDKVYDFQAAILAESGRRHSLYLEKGKIRNHYAVFIKNNESTIEKLNKDIASFESMSVNSQVIESMKLTVKELQEKNDLFRKEMNSLSEEMNILKNGGVIQEIKDNEIVEPEIETNPLVNETNEEPSQEEPEENQYEEEPQIEEEDNELGDEVQEKHWDDMFKDGLNAITDSHFMLEPHKDDVEVIPTPEELPESPDEEIIPVEEVSVPKQTLFQKLKSKIKYAIAFLAGLAIGIGGFAIANNSNKEETEQVEETQNNEETEQEEIEQKSEEKTEEEQKSEEKKEEEQKPEKKKEEEKPEEQKEEENPEEQKEEENPEEQKEEENPEEQKEEENPEEQKEEENPEEQKEEENPEEINTDGLQGIPTEIEAGETIYNPETGVEIGYDGSAQVINDDGSVTPEEDRDLEYSDHDTAIITEDDLNKDDENIPVLNEDELTEGEKDNLDAAIDDVDWEAIFNDNYGPTLKP